MQCVDRQQYLIFETLSKKGYPFRWDKNAHKYDFLIHIEQISKTHKQMKQSAYVFFYIERYFTSFFTRNATNPPFTLRVTVKGDKRAKLTSFHDRKGVRKMKPSSFQTKIEHQFDYICMLAMKNERKNYLDYLSRLAKREVTFSDVGDYLVNQFATTDNYSTDFQIFTLNQLSVGVESDLLSEALRDLPDKKREILLMYYFLDMSDSEIAELLKLNRSTVYRHRNSGLALIKKFMEGLEE